MFARRETDYAHELDTSSIDHLCAGRGDRRNISAIEHRNAKFERSTREAGSETGGPNFASG
jgi:hypothetical protein